MKSMSFGESDSAFQSSPPSSSSGRPALVAPEKFSSSSSFSRVELLVGEMRAFRPRIDERAGGPRGIVEQRLVPEARGIVRVERHLRGGERRKAVVIVERIEEFDMQDRLDPFAAHLVARFLSERAIDEGRGPAVAAGHDAHAIGPQRIEFAQLLVDQNGLDIGVAVKQQIGAERLDEGGAGVERIGPLDQSEQRMVDRLLAALIERARARRRRLPRPCARSDGRRRCAHSLRASAPSNCARVQCGWPSACMARSFAAREYLVSRGGATAPKRREKREGMKGP